MNFGPEKAKLAEILDDVKYLAAAGSAAAKAGYRAVYETGKKFENSTLTSRITAAFGGTEKRAKNYQSAVDTVLETVTVGAGLFGGVFGTIACLTLSASLLIAVPVAATGFALLSFGVGMIDQQNKTNIGNAFGLTDKKDVAPPAKSPDAPETAFGPRNTFRKDASSANDFNDAVSPKQEAKPAAPAPKNTPRITP